MNSMKIEAMPDTKGVMGGADDEGGGDHGGDDDNNNADYNDNG